MKKTIFFILIFFSISIYSNSTLATCHNELKDSTNDWFSVKTDDKYTYQPFADITSAWMQPANYYPATEFGIITKQSFKTGNKYNYNIFFFLDIDNDTSNNAKTGTRAGSDTAFSLLWSVENQKWVTIEWKYDSISDNWDSKVNLSILFMPLDTENGFIIHVPYEILPEDTNAPFRATVATSKGVESMMDTSPDWEGKMSSCNNEKEWTITIIKKNDNENISTNTEIDKETNNNLYYILLSLVAIIFLGGIGMKIKKNEDNSAPEEEITCKCKKCSLYICVWSSSDSAIGSALNLGKAIKRDTEADEKERCCVKIMHFKSQSMQPGRYVRYSSKGKLEWKSFGKQSEGVEKNIHSEVCIWKEVMIVMHGEKKSKVKTVIENISSLIPKAPIKRLVLYYCGGWATLPETEFKNLASILWKRLKKIPKECRPKYVELFIAPTVSFNDEPTFTVLSINKSGLTSFEGKMMKYIADEEGIVTKTGNETPKWRLFGCVELGNLESTPEANTGTYISHWRRICKLPLSEIRKYREYIKKTNKKIKIEKDKFKEPPLCKKEVNAEKIEKVLKDYNREPFSKDELDDLVEKKWSEIKKALKEKIKGK